MYKRVSFLCLFLLFFGIVQIVSAAPTDNDVVSLRGKIKAISGNKVTVVGRTGKKEEVVLLVNTDYIFDGNSGARIKLSDFSKGMEVTAYHSAVKTRSMPPSAQAVAIITGNGPESAKYLKTEKVAVLEDGVRILHSGGAQYLTIKEDVLPYPAQIGEGRELLAWYAVMTLSVPGQATASKVVPISHSRAEIVVHLSTNLISVGEKEVKFIVPKGGKKNVLFLPLRSISENLGYTTFLHEETKTIELYKDGQSIFLTEGINNYRKNGETAKLLAAPRIRLGKMTVPHDFFTILLGHTMEIVDRV